MTRALPQLNKFFVSPDFSASYRRTKQLAFQGQALTGYSVLNCRSGTIRYTRHEKSDELAPEQILILEPNVSFSATGKNIELLHLTFSPGPVLQHAVSMQLIPANSTVQFEPDPILDDVKLANLLHQFLQELHGENPGHEIVMRALVEQIMVQLLRHYSRPRRSDELELSRVGLIDRRIRRSVELMHAQLDQDLSLKTIASESYLSTFHFARLFKKLTGSSPHNYLAAMRATRAQQLLAETDLSITQVAVRVGYLSASHFTKAFRIATGTTPREFRKGLVKL